MANVSVSNTFTNGTTADASQVNQNFTDIINGTSDGTKDFSISALTVGGAFTANGNATLGNASSDDLTITASLASTLNIKTTASFDVGSTTIGLRALFLGLSTFTTKLATAATASWTFTFPTTAGTNGYIMQTDGSGNTSWIKDKLGTTTNDSASSGYIGYEVRAASTTLTAWSTNGSWGDVAQILVPAGDHDIDALLSVERNGSTITSASIAVTTSSGTSSTGQLLGDNYTPFPYPLSTGSQYTFGAINGYRVSVATATTHYLKFNATFSVADPRIAYRIRARTVR